MDFNPEGELFTFDSDNERCVSLPWYEPTRFYHVISGGHHGWLSPQRANFWRLPSYVPDVTPPVATLGRGSPTACICYRHAQFPKEYRGSFLLADWTFGKIWHLPLERKGASYTSQAQVFLEAAGDNGFAPTGMAVHPKTGDLFISIGGRGTRGAVYRVRYPRGLTKAIAIEAAKMTLLTRSLEWDPRLAVELPRLAESKDGLTQMRALQLGARFYLDFKSYEPIEAMIRASCGSNDRFVRQASLDLMREYVQSVRAPVAKLWREDQPRNNEIISLHLATLTTSKRRWSALFPPFDKMILDVPASALVDVARLVQIARGDVSTKEVRGTVFEGYSAPREPQLPYLGPSAELTPAQLSALLLNRFPSGNANADREILRTLAMLGAETPSDLPDRWTVNSNPLDNIHEMIVWARCSNTDRATERVATALLDLDRKITQRNMNRDSHWPLRIAELYAGLAERDAKLNAAMVSHPDFGRPDHALFTQAPGFDRAKAATIFLAKIQSDRDYAVNESVLTTLRALPAAQVNAVVRPLWGQAGHDGAILQLLARQPEAQDRARFVQGLASPQPSVLMASLQALETLPLRRDGEEVFGLLQAWKHAPEPQKELRAILRRRLLRLTRLPADSDEQAWNAWLVEHHSALAKRLTNPDGVDVAAWSKRLANLDWSKGDGDRGRAVFVKASCAACHSGNQATGPDLKGVTKRFSRQDVFTAILQPSRDVPARYQMTQVETRDGKHYQGVVIYDAVDSLILQTAATTTVRLAGSDVNSRRNVPTSLMPAGLLDRLSDEDIADLYAYLQQG
jgi:putative heme-binding domain-containing protein